MGLSDGIEAEIAANLRGGQLTVCDWQHHDPRRLKGVMRDDYRTPAGFYGGERDVTLADAVHAAIPMRLLNPLLCAPHRQTQANFRRAASTHPHARAVCRFHEPDG
ncbi:hypothetical protein A9Q95_12820 [Rhodobacterales bacterium 59_46_T64]|nr:hypothetical protein A9Q95_12820 [Rhodobacterales bacterium 59_46_T64]